jgi:aspartate/methionine/tyrosine aminotransferase
MVIPESLWDAVNKIQDTLLICAPVVSQVAAVAALGVGRAYAASKIGPLAEMRQTIGRALDDPAVPCTVAPAPGAFYFFVRVLTPYLSLDLTERLIRGHRVAVVPGSAFGGDECSIRVSYGALDPSSANEGARRLVRGLQELAAT